jgi:hypothetical protein
MRRASAHRLGAALVVLILLASSSPASAVAPRGGLDMPAPTDYGVAAALGAAQENESRALGDPAVSAAAMAKLSDVVAQGAARTPATGPFELRAAQPPLPPDNPVMKLIPSTPYSNLTSVIDLLFDQPFMILVMVRSGEHVNWAKVRVSVETRLQFLPSGGLLFPFLAQWVYIDIDNDTSTGDASGADVRLRIGPTVAYRNAEYSLIPPKLELQLRGGLALEIERLDPSSQDLPIEALFMKSFRYNLINYTWFLDYQVDKLPSRTRFSLTADQVNISFGGGNLLDRIIEYLNGTLQNGSNMANLAGPYTVESTFDEPVGLMNASLGYLKLTTPAPAQPALMDSASWLTAAVRPSGNRTAIPQHITLWLDSPAFNRTFDHLNWTADIPCDLGLEYVDDRGDNYTQARGAISEMPASFRLKIDNVTDPLVGSVAKLHLTASAPVRSILFDEWEFIDRTRGRYLHSHVELGDLPRELWLNGTLDIGGQAFGPLEPDRSVRNFVPQMIDALMVRIASKLFAIGRTIRSIPQNILNMPDRKGYTSIELPLPGSRLGKLEFWLTSGHYVLIDPQADFFAFYNDTLDNVTGKMVKTSFTGRLLDIRGFHATFQDNKHIELESMYNRELRALFIDAQSDANASLYFSNVPHNVSLDISGTEILYLGDTTVDRVIYTSAIQGQYLRVLLTGVPGELAIEQGKDYTGLTALVGAIDSVDLQVTDAGVQTMAGDHLLVAVGEDGKTAASMHITGLSQVRYSRAASHVTLRTAGVPFSVLVHDEVEDFHMRAKLDPLPASLDSNVSDVLKLGEIKVPTLSSVTSVLEFASMIYAVSKVGADILAAVRDVSTTAVSGLGTFTSDFSLNYTAEGDGLDLVAEVYHLGPVPVTPSPWAHGAVVHQLLYGGEVLMDGKVFLTGLPPSASVTLRSDAGTSMVSLDLRGFKPRYPTLLLVVDGPSQLAVGAARDLDVLLEGLSSPMDLRLDLDLQADMRVGGRIKGSIELTTSQPLGPAHVRMRTRQPQVTTVELLMPRVPSLTKVAFDYSGGVSLATELSARLPLLFIKLSRDLEGGLEPAAAVTLHEVPRTTIVKVEPASSFDLDASTPVSNLPRVLIDASEGGLDVLAALSGRALGNKVDMELDARDLKGVSMTPSRGEWRVVAEQLAFVHLRLGPVPFSSGVTLDRLDLAAESLRSVTLKVHMVFGVYPMFDLGDLRGDALQLGLDGTIRLGGGATHAARIVLLELPLDWHGYPRSHTNGLALQSSDGDHRLIVPAPLGTLLGTVMG